MERMKGLGNKLLLERFQEETVTVRTITVKIIEIISSG